MPTPGSLTTAEQPSQGALRPETPSAHAAAAPLGALGRLPPSALDQVLAEAMLAPDFLRNFAQVSRRTAELSLELADRTLRQRHLREVGAARHAALASAVFGLPGPVPELPPSLRSSEKDARRARQAEIFFADAAAFAPLQVGDRALQQGRGERAEEAFTLHLKSAPDHAGAQLGLVLALRLQDKLGEAESCARQALARLPSDAKLHLALAEVLRRQHRPAKAEASYRRAEALDPANARPWVGLARIALDAGDDADAVEALQRAIALGPPTAAQHAVLAAALHRRRDPAAFDHYERATALSHGADAPADVDEALEGLYRPTDAWLGLGVLLIARGEHARALLALNMALWRQGRPAEFDPTTTAAVHTALATLHDWANDLDAAVGHAVRAVTVLPDDADVLLLLVGLLRRTHRHTEARRFLQQAPQLLQVSFDANLALATLLTRERSHGAAERAYRRALALRPDDTAVLLGLGGALSAQGREAEAEPVLERVATALPDSATAAWALACTKAARQKPAEAERHAQRAVALEPTFAAAWLTLATAQNAQGRTEQALQTLDRALLTGPQQANDLRRERDRLHAQLVDAAPPRPSNVRRWLHRLAPSRR